MNPLYKTSLLPQTIQKTSINSSTLTETQPYSRPICKNVYTSCMQLISEREPSTAPWIATNWVHCRSQHNRYDHWLQHMHLSSKPDQNKAFQLLPPSGSAPEPRASRHPHTWTFEGRSNACLSLFILITRINFHSCILVWTEIRTLLSDNRWARVPRRRPRYSWTPLTENLTS